MSSRRHDAHPLTEFLENAPGFSRRLKETGEPVLLAVEGGTDVTVQEPTRTGSSSTRSSRPALEGIRRRLEDMRAGRTQPVDEAFADIRREMGLPQAP